MTPIIEVAVSDQPQSGLKRKVAVTQILITGEVVAMRAVLQHYANDAGDFGAHIPRFDTLLEKDTNNSWINPNTGQYISPIDPHAIPLEFPGGIEPLVEMDVLKDTQLWAGIAQMLTDTVARIDTHGGLEY